jgi:hypothetical protein
LGKEVVVIAGGEIAAAIVIWKLRVADNSRESATRAVNEAVPAAVGTPLMLPLEFNVNPAGSKPAETVHVYGGAPPCAPMLAV